MKERNKKTCKCFSCKFCRALDVKGHLVKGLSGNAVMIICVKHPHKAGDTGDKPKLYCGDYKKGDGLDNYYLKMGK